MKQIKEVLTKIYDNKELRSSVVPLFIGDPGTGKTKIIEAFAKSRDAKIVEIIASQINPFEVSGMAMPNKRRDKMTYLNFDNLESLKDGDILFFDEVFNGSPVVLNACLTLLESRRTVSGMKLPDIMIIAAANPQGMVPLTPQIKERFLWYTVKFDRNLWEEFIMDKYKMPLEVAKSLSSQISREDFTDFNYLSARSTTKAISMIANKVPTPYADKLMDSLGLSQTNYHPTRTLKISKKRSLLPGESLSYIDILQKNKEKTLNESNKYSGISEIDFDLVRSDVRLTVRSIKKGTVGKVREMLFNQLGFSYTKSKIKESTSKGLFYVVNTNSDPYGDFLALSGVNIIEEKLIELGAVVERTEMCSEFLDVYISSNGTDGFQEKVLNSVLKRNLCITKEELKDFAEHNERNEPYLLFKSLHNQKAQIIRGIISSYCTVTSKRCDIKDAIESENLDPQL